MKKINLLKSALILFFAFCTLPQSWGSTFTVNSSTTSSDALFSVSETMTNYTYSSNWTASDKLISFATGASITVTNVTGATITAITAEGVAANNNNKTVSFTASDGTTTADGTSASWNNRKSTTMTTGQAFNSANVNNFKCGAGQTYTFTNKSSGSYAAGARIVITYTSTLPTSLTNGATTSSSQVVSWTAPSPAPANGYLVAYSTSSTAPGNSVTSTTGSYTVTAISAGTTSTTLSELSGSTTYNWWVRSKNARGNSSWVAGSSFTTESANTYFYRGDDNEWEATAMTISTGGMYEYIASTSSSNKFKIALAADSWEYNKDYNWSGFFMTDQDINLGDYGGDDCYIWDAPASYYILVFKPNTSVNSSSNPHICVSTTLPDDSPSGLAATKTVYLDPGVWETSNAKYAICYVEHNGEWSGFMTESPCFDGIYQTTIPAWVSNVEIVRFSNDATDSDISYDGGKCWNYSGHLSSMPSGAARFTVSQTGGTWNDLNTSNWSTPDLPTYTISYAKGSVPSGGGSISGSKDSESKTCAVDFTLPSSAVFTTTGYTQTGWATSDGGSKAYNLGGSYTTDAAQTFYPFWTIRSYTLTWNLNGGKVTTAGTGAAVNATGSPSSSVNYGAPITTPVVAKAYHSFTGWNTTPATTMPAANTTYTAQWSANQYSVSHTLTDATKTSGATGDNAATYDINYTAVFAAAADHSLPTDITVTIGGATKTKGTEYTWNPETGTVTITGSYITGAISITVTAVELGYRVTYAGNGSTGGTVPSDDTLYDPDAEVTVKGKNTLSKTGYTFTGWSDGTTFYEEGNKFNITSSKTLAAVWEPTNSCTTTLADINFKSSSWSGKTFNQGNTSTSDQINGLYFYSKSDSKQFSLSSNTSNGLTFPDNNMNSGNYYFCIPLQSGEINGKITVTIKHGYSSNSATYNYYFWDGATSYTHGSTNGSSGVQVTDANKSDTQITFEVTTSNANHKGYLYIGRKSSSYIQIYGVTVTTPCPTSTSKTVTFNKGSNPAPTSPSNIPAQKTVPYNHKILRPATDPSASNFIFNGWVTTSGGSTSFDFANTAITANTTIYAKWTAKTAPTTSYTFTLSATCTSASPTATLSGSQSGWSYQLYKDGVASGDPKAGTGSALTWTSLGAGTYLVKTVETPSQASAQIGESATVYASTSITSNLASSRPVNANVSTTVSITATGASPTYQWYTCNSDGTGKVAIEGKTTNSLSYTFTNADAPTKYICCVVTGTCGTITSNIQTVTITPTYLLTYDANGGSGAPADAYRPATTAALSSTQPTRSNYAFEGWNTKSNGSGTRYAAGASFPMPAQATTLYAEWVEMATLTWEPNVNTAESSIGTSSKSSTNTTRIPTSAMSAIGNYGSLKITSNAKSGLTSKIGTPASYDANKYMYVTFTVPAGYEFVPTSISVKAQPVATNKDVKLILTDGANTITKTQTNLSQGSTTPVTETNSAKTAFKGTVTLKIYCYGATDDYRLGTPITVSGKVRPVTLTYVGGSGSNWNTTANWSPACIPTIDHDVVIEVPVDVNITNARAKSVVIYNNGSTKTGQLVLGAGKELVVDRTVRKTTNGSSYTATGENDIVFGSTSALGLGALVIGEHNGTNKATVNFTTRSAGVKDDNTSIAQYVGTPFNDENNILHNWYNSWIYGITYDGSRNIGWERVEEGSGMTPFKGYCVFSADGANHVYWEQGTLNASTDQTISGLNWQSGTGSANLNNENLLANSWTAPIYIKAMESSDFVNADATIYIFNSTSASAYESDGFGGNYDSYTVNTANAVIPAMQSFSVFTTGSGASVTLDYNKIVYEPAVAGTATPAANRAPRRERKTEAEANKLRLFVRTENGLGDMLYMWEREDFSEAFENGWDGRKMYGENYAPQLFAITPDGAMAVNCVPTYEGVLIGFRAGTDELAYTFSFEYDDDAEPLYLYDLYADTYTRVLNGNTYLFVANDYDTHARFSLTHYMPGVATGTEDVSQPTSGVRKVLFNDHIYILRDGRLYDVTGKTVK